MPLRQDEPQEGYWIFMATEQDDKGYEKVLNTLLAKIKKAEKTFTVKPLTFTAKEGVDSRSVVVAIQTAMLERK